MALLKCILGVVVLLSVSVWSVSADLGNGTDAGKASEKQVKKQVDLSLDQDTHLKQDPDPDQDTHLKQDPDQDTHLGLKQDPDLDQDTHLDPTQDPDPDQDESIDTDEDMDLDEGATEEPPEETDEPPEDTDEPPEETDEPPEETDESPEETDEPPEETDEPPEDTDEPPEETDEPPEETDEPPEETDDPPEDDASAEEEDEDVLSVSERLEMVNKNLVGDEGSEIEDGDVVVPKSHVRKRNADPCTRRGCRWRRSRNGKVYVPYVIANHYSSAQRRRIHRAFRSFTRRTCIRFVPRCRQRDYLYIHSSKGCSSYIGRRGRRQKLSLNKNGCVYLGIIQHELLHALGFHHEHKRSDRDKYVRVLWNNIKRKYVHNFRKICTRNLGTPYDYSSVMHYRRTSFSKNGRPTLVARRRNVTFGRAKRMSRWDIIRVNRLYCR